MCGIVGYAVADGPEPGEGFLQAACASMAHRGPDGQGTWRGSGVGLGHRRLAIIDLSGGAQPMSDADGRYWITFNGEIYNYRELRQELAGRGHRFRTSSDTEVLLAAYDEWGVEAPARLRGIFAFAIWDVRERSLFLSRDHLGVKPLFFEERPGRLVFASELKAILHAGDVGREADPEALNEYLSLGYALGTRTLVGGVSRLRPATYLLWRDGTVKGGTYWDLAPLVNDGLEDGTPAGEWVARYAAALDHAVTRQMVSDVPVGGFLSGGVDSSTIVYHMRDRTPTRVKTFSMGFDEPSFSELPYAARVAAALETEHHAAVVKPDWMDGLPDLVRLFDEPLGDTSIMPTYFVSRLARQMVKVVLSGDGADECLAGYDTYAADRMQRLYRRLPRSWHLRLLLPLSRRIPPTGRKVGLDYKLRQFVAHAHGDLERAHFGWRLLFDEDERAALLSGRPPDDPAARFAAYFDMVKDGAWLNRCLYVDLQTWLACDILTKVDRASMAVGLEARVPFLDVDLVELAMRLPTSLKMGFSTRKVVLRRVMKGRLPDEVLARRKSGFNAPVSAWLRGPLRGLADDLFRGSSGLVDLRHPALATLWKDHLTGGRDHGFKLWSLLMLLLWERVVLQGTVASPWRGGDSVAPVPTPLPASR